MSPILFNIVTAKIFHRVVNVSLCQYADDFVLFSTNKDIFESISKLQGALIIFNELLNDMGLELSVKKSKFCIFSRGHRRQRVELKVDTFSLELVEVYKYLGLWLDKSLRWGKHIGETVIKVQKCFNLLNVLAGSSWGVHTKHLRQIYLALIRSRIDYGSFIYDNAAKCHLIKLDRLQNQALRITGGFIKTTPIHVMESELCIPPLKQRRRDWKEYFDKMSLEKGIWYRTLQSEPPHIPWSSCTRMKRKYVVLAHRLRSGHIPGNKFGFLMGKTSSPNCDSCGVIDDVYHWLVECVRFQSGRDRLVELLNLKRLQTR
ncbi:uncharacterized protein LOC123874015 [Maniola jurtina]|uniref:uncharacterized protein LOC123874015 n=1 Tax=Maniola jurtina TaxID=191418 RepID=UPI001E687552|nr:uncharacterized protein LOC123874015 [Maniola jurtina]